MAQIPFGYRINDGRIETDQDEGEKIRLFYRSYLKGNTISSAALEAGLLLSYSSAGRILHNTIYLGNEYYPRIIDPSVFEQVQTERKKRYRKQGSPKRERQQKTRKAETIFTYEAADIPDLKPAARAGYIYSRIQTLSDSDQ